MQKINVELISNFINKNNLKKTKFCKICSFFEKFYNRLQTRANKGEFCKPILTNSVKSVKIYKTDKGENL